MLRLKSFVLLHFLRKLILYSIQLCSDLSVSFALIIGNRATLSSFDRLPVGVLKLQRSCQQTKGLTSMNLPEHECLRERDSTSEAISSFLQLSKVGF